VIKNDSNLHLFNCIYAPSFNLFDSQCKVKAMFLPSNINAFAPQYQCFYKLNSMLLKSND